jgi:hypothetical protein
MLVWRQAHAPMLEEKPDNYSCAPLIRCPINEQIWALKNLKENHSSSMMPLLSIKVIREPLAIKDLP